MDDHPYRLCNYIVYERELDDTGISYPKKITDVKKFANKKELIINVFGWNNESLDILHTDSRLYKIDLPVVNLLLYNDHYYVN